MTKFTFFANAMPKTIKVVHERGRCIGCKSCHTIAPQNWSMDEKDGKANLIGSLKKGNSKDAPFVGEIFDCDIAANKKAAAACPVKIIKVRD